MGAAVPRRRVARGAEIETVAIRATVSLRVGRYCRQAAVTKKLRRELLVLFETKTPTLRPTTTTTTHRPCFCASAQAYPVLDAAKDRLGNARDGSVRVVESFPSPSRRTTTPSWFRTTAFLSGVEACCGCFWTGRVLRAQASAKRVVREEIARIKPHLQLQQPSIRVGTVRAFEPIRRRWCQNVDVTCNTQRFHRTTKRCHRIDPPPPPRTRHGGVTQIALLRNSDRVHFVCSRAMAKRGRIGSNAPHGASQRSDLDGEGFWRSSRCREYGGDHLRNI